MLTTDLKFERELVKELLRHRRPMTESPSLQENAAYTIEALLRERDKTRAALEIMGQQAEKQLTAIRALLSGA